MCEDIHALPRPHTARGTDRRVGVEVEFGGLPEARVAEIIAAECGGWIEQGNEKGLVVRDSALGDIEAYLDTALLTKPGSRFEENLHELARTVVPVEIVTGPLRPAQIEQLDSALRALRAAGATGTASGVTAGFGVHFNPEVVSTHLRDILPVLSVFAFCEDALRAEMGLDLSRRMLPFVDPYPRGLLDGLAAGGIHSTSDLIDLYLARAPSRNHGLDMLCLFSFIDEKKVAARMATAAISARPTFHYRLPDCRIDEEGWSLALEWNRWVRIEELAEDEGLVRELAREWRLYRDAFTTTRPDWTRRTREMAGRFS